MPSRFLVIRDDTPPGDIPHGSVVALGNFDSVHLGHRAVIGAAVRMARASGQAAMAMTFEPHPRDFFDPAHPQFRLMSAANKLRLLAGTGLDGAVVMTFDADRAKTSAHDFIARDLIGRLQISGLSIGRDFHFGAARTGSAAFLTNDAPRLGIAVHVEPPFGIAGQTVSSTLIRAALTGGRIAEANAMLGYPWFVTGEVIHGEKRGRDLGYPTANIRLPADNTLRHGIYAVRVGLDGRRLDGVASFGRRPTFDNGAPLLETFIFDFKGNLYGKAIDVALIGFIRDEAKFDSLDALIRQMDNDSARARALLAAAPDAFPALGDVGS